MAKKRIPKKIEKEISRYVDVLKKDKLPISKVILFGSYAKGNPHEWSDIDLCIISPKFNNSFDALTYLSKKTSIGDIQHPIEPFGFTLRDMQNKYDSLIHEIKTTGIEMQV